ncbi:MAG: hypothetical protein HOO19_19740 [Rhodospirillaceae bacterium]|jgi:hypothetical protein|nr:hypothetical protein [Rhodospirillaceae bacterium]MBT3885528.1 hypothetical protein [Rhodospirillaceae bacterium]MBT4114847.1 hypothetical protein [Rhodospirillaceae bacterium]MBT4674552.1 hypothetical protein [Rhodospirillaceae bacterium]MBT4719035.1 hypothetical protein [Rhodospirillaceae bacterium]
MSKAARLYGLILTAALAGAARTPAQAHFGLADGDDVGSGLFWVYGFVFASLAAFLIYRKRARKRQSPEQRTLNFRLVDLERALTACLAELKNADDYPGECGLTFAERQERQVSASSIREKIAALNAEMMAHLSGSSAAREGTNDRPNS